MAYINDLFKVLVKNSPYSWIKDWASDYERFTNDIQILKERLSSDPETDINESSLYLNLITFNSYNSFLKKLLYDRSNGVSSRGQSILSKDNLEKAKNNVELKNLIKEIVINPNSQVFTRFSDWWFKTFNKRNQLLINRAFAACSPKTLTSTVDNDKFNHVRQKLISECDITFQNEGKNWLEWNELLTTKLDELLQEELSEFETELAKNNWRNIFVWLLYEYNPSSFDLKKQLVKYGAPGTGKTFSSKREVQNHFLLWKGLYNNQYENDISFHLTTVQFHPSYTYEDFLEGIRPVVNEGRTELQLVNGVFKNFCKKAASWEIDIYNQLPELKDAEWSQIKVSDVVDRLDGDKWLYLRNVTNPSKTPLHKVIPPFYIIIDEINRAELSRVLGELMYCLEYRGYRGKIKTQYSSMVTEGAETSFWFENGSNYFYIPNNLYLIGTMNNIDRSVESFDFALRRRFYWEEVKPDYDLIINDNLPEHLESIVWGLKKLNEKIAEDPLLGKDYRIGHSYFMNRPDFINKLSLDEARNHYWQHSIKPLLEEYLRGSGENNRIKEFENIFKQKK